MAEKDDQDSAENLRDIEKKFGEFGLATEEDRDRFRRLAELGGPLADEKGYFLRLSTSSEQITPTEPQANDAELARPPK
jgi:hypothetical protein